MPRADRMAGLVLAALTSSVVLMFAGCATLVATPSVDVLAHFAMSTASDVELEAAWWNGYGDPVLIDRVQRAAREDRDLKIAAERLRAARAGVTVSRSFLMHRRRERRFRSCSSDPFPGCWRNITPRGLISEVPRTAHKCTDFQPPFSATTRRDAACAPSSAQCRSANPDCPFAYAARAVISPIEAGHESSDDN